MIYYVLIGLAGLYALYASFGIQKLSARIITLTQVIAIAMTLTGIVSLFKAGMYLYDFSLLLIILYGLFTKDLSKAKRSALAIPVVLIFLVHSFRIFHLPGAAWLSLSMIIPMIVFALILIRKRTEYKNEIGFIVVILTDACIKLMEQAEKVLLL